MLKNKIFFMSVSCLGFFPKANSVAKESQTMLPPQTSVKKGRFLDPFLDPFIFKVKKYLHGVTADPVIQL